MLKRTRGQSDKPKFSWELRSKKLGISRTVAGKETNYWEIQPSFSVDGQGNVIATFKPCKGTGGLTNIKVTGVVKTTKQDPGTGKYFAKDIELSVFGVTLAFYVFGYRLEVTPVIA